MPAEISQITINEKEVVEAMYASKPTWHGLGTIFKPGENEGMNSKEAMVGAHLDWQVDKLPMFLGDNTPVEDFYSLCRIDTRKTLSVVGNDYQLLQNTRAFEFLDGLIKDRIMKYEAAFSLRGGKQVVLLARFPSIDFVTPEDYNLRYVAFINSHGMGSVQILPTSVRMVCANTVNLGLRLSKNTLNIRHSGNLESKLSIAQSYISQFDAAFDKYREGAKSLLVGYSPAQGIEYIKTLFPEPANDAGVKTKTFYNQKMAQLSKHRSSPANNLASIRGTWYSLVNVISEYCDHGQKSRASKDIQARQENNFTSNMIGPSADLKNRAFDLALEMAA